MLKLPRTLPRWIESAALVHVGLCLLAISTLPSSGAAQDASVEYRDHPFWAFDSPEGYTANIALVDVDGDGDLDALTANGRHWAQQDYAFLNSGDGRMLEAVPVGPRFGPSYALCPGDFDGDGDADLVVVRDILPAQLFLNDGSANYSFAAVLSGSGGASRSGIVVDVDGDGALDIVIARRRGAESVFYGNGQGGFSTNQDLPGGGRGSTGVAAGDLDGDGDLDLVFARRDQEPSVVMMNAGGRNFELRTLEGSVGDHRKAVIADFDRDGSPDIVLASTDGRHKLFKGNHAAGFGSFSLFGSEGRLTQAMASGDLDGDGDIDLVEGTEESNALYLNRGDGTFDLQEIPGQADTYGVAVGDMNGDGRLDLVFANSKDVNVVRLAQ